VRPSDLHFKDWLYFTDCVYRACRISASMQSNVKRPVSAHHIFRTETKENQGCPIRDGGTKYPNCEFGWAVLTEELPLRKSKKSPVFLLQNISWLKTSTGFPHIFKNNFPYFFNTLQY